ncbi:hypothetical protein A9179_16195 [Pseudomonas alcaligenes]|uniref:Lipoprotein n=1 Tax=Aquipseudomonas alcaligenes TaxID=43263 RepID=A0ABR7S459_AQUAC|nr:hypothetical protein [Pseudomonas alcaligenes]MBC9251812.1 hypothetical protein [Pseudomonas alcaligenes]
MTRGYLRVLLVACVAALAGCASTPPVVVPASTWRQVDRDIARASQDAAAQAREHALLAMRQWMERVYRQTDDEFIPWFSSYWTQQWLGVKVSWYKLNSDGEDETVGRLALYLQEQYQERVLEPVAEEDDPQQIMARSTRLYIEQLGLRLPAIAVRHGVPAEQFDQRLQALPAIVQSPGASVYDLLQADPLERQPAYVALVERIRSAPGGLRDWSADPGISQVAQRASERLVGEMATSGAASAVAAAIGRVAGTTLSLGVALFTAIARENDRPDSEAQLRHSLNNAFEQEWQALLHSPERGVLAGVQQLSGQIEGGLGTPFRYSPPR